MRASTPYTESVDADSFDEQHFFETIARSGARALVIGRRALVALGAPLLTADYDLWVHIDDIEILNAALDDLDLAPNYAPSEARMRGRYVLEASEHVDVLIARSKTTKDGIVLTFDDAWSRRQNLPLGALAISIPSIDDLILTKRWAMREKDLADIAYLEDLKRHRP